MATSDFWQRLSASVASSKERVEGTAGESLRGSRAHAGLWMLSDAITIFLSAMLAALYVMRTDPADEVEGFWQGTLFHGRSMGILLVLLFGFVVSLIMVSHRLSLYSPARLTSFLHEQRLSVQACFVSGLFLTGTLYLLRAEDIPRSIVLITLGLVTVALSLRRLFYRFFLYRRFERGMDTRNVLIVGTGPEAHALRHHLESIPRLGYAFKGFIEFPSPGSRFAAASGDVVGTLETLFKHARKQFVDEIFFTTPCEHGVMLKVLERARSQGVGLRMVPEMYDGLTWNSPIEYIGQFPTIPLHCGHVPETRLLLKSFLDVVFSSLVLIGLFPFLVAIAIAVKLDSSGPVFYYSERLGKKGRVFRLIKFRTMVSDADKRRAEVMHLNERESVLFKMSNDPRITRFGAFLRKFSLDELPQFLNVLHGDMSVVGPRPPLACEVREYKLAHLRRLDVTPGITGLWQVLGRKDPSFDSYISLDVTYIENWSIWLDIKIILRTIGVVFSGTGS